MYQNYFGFKERPFQLVPNPAYLFLSRSHEEAMAHLTYAVSEGDGFIAIIGEVGTGKTTLCRAFIESLDNRREMAYIFNPKLTAVELLGAVCDEFGLQVPENGTTKDLIDTLNRFLLSKRAEGKQVMLIIDEAQNLSREVLEQLRLLSNLETNTEKLLQIVLVGQPELDDLLETFELRQLSQRITLCCHLSPLTFKETVGYVQHRIRIAARNQGVTFTQPALRKIHAFSKGTPRLIHIVCDRALLTAYVSNREKITAPIVDAAIRELGHRNDIGRLRVFEKRKTALLGALFCLLVVMLFVIKPMDSGIAPETEPPKAFKIPSVSQEKNPPASAASTEAKMPADPDPEPVNSPLPESLNKPPETADSPSVAKQPASAQASPGHVPDLANFLAGINSSESKKTALSGALSLWGTSLPIREYADKDLVDPETYFHLTARRNGFQVHRMQSDRTGISKLNLPAIFEFALPTVSKPFFLTLVRASEESFTFTGDAPGNRIDVAPDDVERLWTGIAYVPWTNFFEYEGVTPISGGEQGVLALKELLEKIGYDHLPSGPVYDPETESLIKDIQKRYDIPVDGLVGPLTKMVLYNELTGLGIPHILENGAALPPFLQTSRTGQLN
jgi:general secretion pathway protein A